MQFYDFIPKYAFRRFRRWYRNHNRNYNYRIVDNFGNDMHSTLEKTDIKQTRFNKGYEFINMSSYTRKYIF